MTQSGDSEPRETSDNLLKGKRVLTIEHEGEQYQLRKTKRNKLILTKPDQTGKQNPKNETDQDEVS